MQCREGNTTDYCFGYDDRIIRVFINDGRIEFYQKGVFIGFDSEIRNARGERIYHPAASGLHVAEFADDIDRKLVMLLLGTFLLR